MFAVAERMKSLGNRLPRFWFRGRPSGSTSWGNFFWFFFAFWVTFFPILGPSFENQIGTPKRGPQDNFSWGGPDFGYHFGAQNGDPKFQQFHSILARRAVSKNGSGDKFRPSLELLGKRPADATPQPRTKPDLPQFQLSASCPCWPTPTRTWANVKQSALQLPSEVATLRRPA